VPKGNVPSRKPVLAVLDGAVQLAP